MIHRFFENRYSVCDSDPTLLENHVYSNENNPTSPSSITWRDADETLKKQRLQTSSHLLPMRTRTSTRSHVKSNKSKNVNLSTGLRRSLSPKNKREGGGEGGVSTEQYQHVTNSKSISATAPPHTTLNKAPIVVRQGRRQSLPTCIQNQDLLLSMISMTHLTELSSMAVVHQQIPTYNSSHTHHIHTNDPRTEAIPKSISCCRRRHEQRQDKSQQNQKLQLKEYSNILRNDPMNKNSSDLVTIQNILLKPNNNTSPLEARALSTATNTFPWTTMSTHEMVSHMDDASYTVLGEIHFNYDDDDTNDSL